MKKLAILLCLVMVFAAVLSACGESGTESKADSSAASEAASEAANESKDSASSEAEAEQSAEDPASSEAEAEQSEPAEQSEEAPVTPGDGENIALSKAYTISGCGKGYTTADGATVYNADLTDGVAHDVLTYGNTNNWFGFYNSATADASVVSAPGGIGTAIIDLGASAAFKKVRIHVCTPGNAGIGTPTLIEVDASDDGNGFTDFGSTSDFDESNGNNGYWVEITGEGTGRYVRVTVSMDPGGVFMFLNEIEVIG